MQRTKQQGGNRATRRPSIKKSCDYCVKRKRHCDGLGWKRCSSCDAKNVPECHYSARSPMPPKKPAKTSSGRTGNVESPMLWSLAGRVFRRTDGDNNADSGGHRPAQTDSMMLQLKRSRLRPSPATGLVGLQESGFLSDFFGCMGFLSLTSESAVRGAMVSIMLADRPQHAEAQTKFPTGGQDIEQRSMLAKDDIEQAMGNGRHTVGSWSEALTADDRVLPCSAPTCLLWCAVALGALVRGRPLSHVRQYVDLAQESLAACFESATLDTARAFIAMAFLHNFLGDKAKNQEYLKLATTMVDNLPPGQLPAGLYETLRYAGKAGMFEEEHASTEEGKFYWEDAAPVWKLSNSVVEHDLCGLVIAVDRWLDQPFLDDNGNGAVPRVFMAEDREATKMAMAPNPPAGNNREPQKAGSMAAGENVDMPLAATETCAEMRKQFLPEMLRLANCMESSDLHLGIGGLLYYGRLSYMQVLDNDVTAADKSFKSFVDVMLRYPGLCRYTCGLHIAHAQLWAVVSTCSTVRDRHRYEELRAVYNPVRPTGSPRAPPFEEWTGIADICDNAYCRKAMSGIKSFTTIIRGGST